jgi:hypothetical protein
VISFTPALVAGEIRQTGIFDDWGDWALAHAVCARLHFRGNYRFLNAFNVLTSR